LCEVAQRLQACVREGNSVARLGGDEFVIALPGLADGAAAEQVARQVSVTLQRPFRIAEHELHVEASVGISLFPADADNVQSLIRAAESAMYHAKQQGRGNFQFFTHAMNEA